MYLLDTNTCIFLKNKKPLHVLDKLRSVVSTTLSPQQIDAVNQLLMEKVEQDSPPNLSLMEKNQRIDELAVDPANHLEFLLGTGNQDHAIGLQALMFPKSENALRNPILIDPHSAEPVTRHAALAIAKFDQPALAGKNLG